MASLFSFRSLRLVPIDGAGAPRCCRPPYEGFRPLLGCSSNRDGRRIFTDGLSESRHGSGTYAGRWSLVEARKANAEALRFARERRRLLTTRSGMVTEEEGLAGPEAANILRGLPTYHVKEKDLEKNFLEVDPDNPTPLLEYFSALLRQGNLEPNEAQKELMSKLQVLMDDIEAFNLKSGDPFDPLTARPPSAPAPPSSANEALHRVKSQRRYEDPLFEVAKQVRSQAQVLCFDEFQVVHITDAMILKRLFEFLFSFGAIVVATSNRPPVDLYKGGLNRQRFLPFIDLLLDSCEVFHIETHKDYRLSKMAANSHGLYFVRERPQEEILKQMLGLTQGEQPEPGVVQVAMGRELQVPLMAKGVAQFAFADLCEAAMGTPDFLAVARNFHTVFLSRIPELTDMQQFPNEIRRFIDLVDVLYEKHVRVIFDAAAPPFRLLGITATTANFEELRQAIQKKFPTVQAFFEALQPFLLESEKSISQDADAAINRENWVKGAHLTVGVSTEAALQVFEKIDVQSKGILPLDAIRSGLYFHMLNFDVTRPTEKNVFLFQGRPATLGSPKAVGYELFNEGGSSGAQDIQFAYVRTVSRIRDMISTSYLEDHQKIFKLQDLRLFGVPTPPA